ncbi:MAG: hypothetical protein WCI11_19895 [Candidatus Methylumidiphilus sp.]
MSADAVDKKPEERKFSIALPCSQEDFGDFIGSLLGKPQTISKAYRGAFEVKREDIQNSYHLLIQRVKQQNRATLIQFCVKLVYDDNSTVLLNSFEDFSTYNEVRPLVVVQAHLSWSFIVTFQDRNHPEKQEIDLSFITSAPGGLAIFETDDSPVVLIAKLISGGIISFRIRHTARTWGADIESLLAGHVKHIILPQSKVRDFTQRHSGKIALALALLFFAGTVGVCTASANKISAEQLQALGSLLQNPYATDQKINKLLEFVASGFWGKYFFSVFVFTIFSFVAAILFGIWTETSADTRRPSYILLTKKSEQHKTETDRKYHFKWWSFMGSIAVSITTGVVSNILFTKYWVG